MLIRWDQRADSDVVEIFRFLLERNTTAARRIRQAIHDHVALLASHPWLGHAGRQSATRELVVARTPYIIVYTVDTRTDVLTVLRVLHGARRWPEEL
jgi:toxin ParE1/3/4